MNLDAVQLVADFLKVLAVPAGVIEFLDAKRRQAIESWLSDTLPKIIKGTAITLVVLYVTVLLLVALGPWLVLIFLVFGKLITQLLMLAIDDDDARTGCMAAGFVLSIVVVIASVLEKWAIPESWVLALAYPYETFSVWANGNWLVDWLLPDFTAQGFLRHYREVFNETEEWLWDWLAFFYSIYFFFTRGFLLVLVAFIQIAFLASIVLTGILIPLTPLHFVMKLSEYVKRRLHFQASGRLPVMGLLVLALGEGMGFAIDVIKVAG